jgi:20S proteasome alpha/beta subunit
MRIPIFQITTQCLCGFTGLVGDSVTYVGFAEVAL